MQLFALEKIPHFHYQFKIIAAAEEVQGDACVDTRVQPADWGLAGVGAPSLAVPERGGHLPLS